MRNDFISVFVERPRYGRSMSTRVKGKGQSKLNPLLDQDDNVCASHESMTARWQRNRKEMRDHFAPLNRYLRAQVGRPYDQVFSDICHVFKGDSACDQRLREHLSWEVEQNVRHGEDGELIGRNGYNVGANSLYVDANGILTLTPARIRRRWKNKPLFETVKVDDARKYVKLDGLWFLVTLAEIPGEEVTDRPFDVVLKRPVFASDRDYSYDNQFARAWGSGLYASHKRQAGSREIRDLLKQIEAVENKTLGIKASKFSKTCHRPQRQH
jgi:hypothetical protein